MTYLQDVEQKSAAFQSFARRRTLQPLHDVGEENALLLSVGGQPCAGKLRVG